MNENGKKKREWVKTAAIIFLSVMLVLTFFANTIQNYSLPEVATSYVQSGMITAKIRGTGQVVSGDPYVVKSPETRKVASVAVRAGDIVQKGDVLLYLEDEESEELQTAKKALEDAKNAYDLALLSENITSSDIFSATEGVTSEVYRQQITNAQAALTRAERAYDAAVAAYDAAKAAEKPYEDKVNDVQRQIDNHAAQIAHDSDPNLIAMNKSNIEAAQAEYDKANAVSGGDSAVVKPAAEKFAAAQKVENDRANGVINLSKAKADWELQLYIVQQDLTAAKNVTAQREEEVKAAEKEKTEKMEDLTKLSGNIQTVMELQQKLDAVNEAQKKVDELTAKSVDATITAPISGTVSEVKVTAGETAGKDAEVVTMQPEGAGYTLSVTVTNEQAKRLSVGDKADLVNAWRYDDVEVTLAKIKPDKQDPGQKKELIFNVTGQVTVGQTFNISVGQKSANYDLIVPNSAIREDTNGKFILIVESKSSPLGNRYVATRVDVEVLASDDTQSAISGAVNNYAYVITTSNKPVEAGKLVRMPE